MGYASPEAAKAYWRARYASKKKGKVRPYGVHFWDKNYIPLVTKNSILFFFGEGHEGLGLKEGINVDKKL